MHRLGDVEEVVRAADHLPVGDEARSRISGTSDAEDLRHAATESGGVHVEDTRTNEVARIAVDRFDGAFADGGAVHFKMLRGQP